ncbi:hypothetical protein [Haloterrigena sp. H1]|uniref:hypothetical protein n=1 Tax=Haloterrigena sp. H1 TaxID=2552943 RepID=UPI0014861886|nr:hypothetical protein [Haloterrigena sp. H1]
MTWVRSLLSRSREGKIGLPEVGGMVSGGIYAVLGVAMRQAGNAVPLSYLIAGAITENQGESPTLQGGDESDTFLHKPPFDGTAGYSTLRNPYLQVGFST